MSEFLLLLSLTGFFLFLRRFRRDLPPAFCPALTVSLISVLVTLGGLAGILAETAGVLFFSGLLSFAVFGALSLRQALRKQLREPAPFLRMLGSFLFFSVCSVLLLKDRFLYNYDDFSHWGLVARILLKESRLPVSADELMFPSYPPGAASFIFFCGSVPGFGPDAGLAAQGIMLVSFLISLQSAAGKSRTGFLLTTALIPLFMFYNTSLNSLSVDNLLGASFLSAMLLFLRQGRELRKVLPELMLMLAACILIKNSGFFLAVFLIALAAPRLIKSKPGLSPSLLWLLLPPAVYLAWRIHLSAGFTSFGKHYMSLSVYYGTLRRRLGELGLIFRVILPVMVNPLTNHALLLIPAFALVFRISPPQKREEQKKILLLCAALFALYEAGTLVMYICSMGTGELVSQNGADFPRYNGTVICVLAGMLICMAGNALAFPEHRSMTKNRILLLAAAVCLAACMGMNLKPLPSLEECRRDNPDACVFSRLTEDRTFSAAQRFVVQFQRPTAEEYEYYMAYYYLYPARHITCCGSSEEVPSADGAVFIDLRQPVSGRRIQ